MTVCEFCAHYQRGECRIGLNLPKKMACHEFRPAIEQFCSDPKDFASANQIVEMAKYFGFQKMELKKITVMATKEESARADRERMLKAAAIAGALGNG